MRHARLVDRLYFTGFTVFTLGVGDMVPGQGWWQVATVAATGTGLALVTTSITFLVPVASATAQRRHLASTVAALGGSPHDIVREGWNGSDFSGLVQQLVNLPPTIQMSRQQHLAYPVLHRGLGPRAHPTSRRWHPHRRPHRVPGRRDRDSWPP